MNSDPYIVFMILTHQGNVDKLPKWPNKYSKYLAQFPWIKVVGIYGGDTSLDTMPAEYKYLPISDVYECLNIKVLEGIKYIYKTWPTVKGIYKIDDDVEIINIMKLIQLTLKWLNNKTEYLGYISILTYNMSKHHISRCTNPDLQIPLPCIPNVSYCGGPMYLLGKRSIHILAGGNYEINTIYEDNMVGYILNTHGIQPINYGLYINYKGDITEQLKSNAIGDNSLNEYLAIHNCDHADNFDIFISQKKLEIPLDLQATNYISLTGGICNNIHQIAAAWHYALLGNGANIACAIYNINKTQVSDEIHKYYSEYICGSNMPILKNINQYNIKNKCFDYINACDIIMPTTNIQINGYFQNLQYINHINSLQIGLWRHILESEDTALYEAFNGHTHINWLGDRNGFMSVHIRFGDYVGHPMHNVKLEHSIKTIISNLLSSTNAPSTLVFFSDDIEKLKREITNYIDLSQVPITIQKQSFFVVEPDPLKTLRLMSACNYGNLCVNSTFSVWGAILNPNPNKIVFIPSKWLNNKEGDDVRNSFKTLCKNVFFY